MTYASQIAEEMTPASQTAEEITPASQTAEEITPASQTAEEITPASETAEEITPASQTAEEITPASQTAEEMTPASQTKRTTNKESEEENCCRCSEHLAQGDTIVSPASSPRSPIKVKKTRLLTATGSPQDLLRRDVRRESEQTPPRAVLELTVMMEGAINSWCGCGCGCNSIATIPKTEEPSLLPEEGPEEAHEEKRLRCAQASTTRRLKKNSVVWGTTIPFLIILFIGIFTACLTG
ncbi:uncharacterized protein [Hyperolius riggenbachi]|uniref:uncharacterized protein isoform X2 n=1 Tax=Hyperolius riggenbachi TaxID=752182 RepID=UPI0035A3B0D4